MRYYIIDNEGNVHGDAGRKAEADAMLQDIITTIGQEEADRIEIEVVEGE